MSSISNVLKSDQRYILTSWIEANRVILAKDNLISNEEIQRRVRAAHPEVFAHEDPRKCLPSVSSIADAKKVVEARHGIEFPRQARKVKPQQAQMTFPSVVVPQNTQELVAEIEALFAKLKATLKA